MTVLRKYELYCETESTTVHTDWRETIPTVCPNNDGHTIDTDSIVVNDVVTTDIMQVEVVEEPYPIITGGHFQAHGFKLTVPSGDVGNTTNLDISFPFPVSIIDAKILIGSQHVGDSLRAEAAPDTVVGALAAAVVVDDDVITVTSTVIENIAVGFCVKLSDGVNTDDLGRVTAVDADASQITIEIKAEHAFSAATPTYVKMTSCHVPYMYLSVPGLMEIGAANLTSSQLPAGKVLRIIYTNNSTDAKDLTILLEYKY